MKYKRIFFLSCISVLLGLGSYLFSKTSGDFDNVFPLLLTFFDIHWIYLFLSIGIKLLIVGIVSGVDSFSFVVSAVFAVYDIIFSFLIVDSLKKDTLRHDIISISAFNSFIKIITLTTWPIHAIINRNPFSTGFIGNFYPTISYKLLHMFTVEGSFFEIFLQVGDLLFNILMLSIGTSQLYEMLFFSGFFSPKNNYLVISEKAKLYFYHYILILVTGIIALVVFLFSSNILYKIATGMLFFSSLVPALHVGSFIVNNTYYKVFPFGILIRSFCQKDGTLVLFLLYVLCGLIDGIWPLRSNYFED